MDDQIPILDRKSPRIFPILGAILAFILLLSSLATMDRRIAYTHDELWDYIPAVAMIRAESVSTNQEVSLLNLRIPLTTGPYHGALKAWISGPWVMIAGTAPHSLRFLNLIYAIAYLFALYWALLPAAGPRWAALAFAAPFVDTNFLITTPLDYGPTLFQCIFISLSLGSCLRYLATRQTGNIWLIFFFSGCTLAQKLTSIPIVIAFLFLALIFCAIEFREKTRPAGLPHPIAGYISLPTLLFIMPLVPHLIYFAKAGLGPLLEMAAPASGNAGSLQYLKHYFAILQDNFVFFTKMFNGQDWFRRATNESIPSQPVHFLAAWTFVAIGLSTLLSATPRADRKSALCALTPCGLFLASFILMPVFPDLNRPWHFYILHPLFLASSVLATIHIKKETARILGNRRIPTDAFIAAIILAGIVAGSIQGVNLLRRFDRAKSGCLQSTTLNDIYRKMRAANVRNIYAINYSLAYPIYVLAKGTVHVSEFCWQDLTPSLMEDLIQKVKTVPFSAIIYRQCGCNTGEPDYIDKLNRTAELRLFTDRLKSEWADLNIVVSRDESQTEHVLITATPGAIGP
jgi:hypothetical protein